jgi:hypothetical protein
MICLVFKKYTNCNCGILSRAIFKQVVLFLTSKYNWKKKNTSIGNHITQTL